jgi:DeoR/GlpR family transcriptional regulator of sugar metabolism
MVPDSHADRPLFADERQMRIAELVNIRGSVRNVDLVDLLGVTEPTIRKDMRSLEKQGVLKRTHGGAIALRPSVESALEVRTQRNAEAKEAIAIACVREIHDGDAIFLDSGTTIQRIANKLVSRYITVLTNSVGVAEAVADMPTIEHILLGGRLRRVSGSLVGAFTLDAIEHFTVNVAFLSASGFSESGVTVADVEEAKLKAAIIERARRTILAIDHEKVGATHFARVCDLEAIDTLVIDQANAFVQDLCQANNIEIIIANSHA